MTRRTSANSMPLAVPVLLLVSVVMLAWNAYKAEQQAAAKQAAMDALLAEVKSLRDDKHACSRELKQALLRLPGEAERLQDGLGLRARAHRAVRLWALKRKVVDGLEHE